MATIAELAARFEDGITSSAIIRGYVNAEFASQTVPALRQVLHSVGWVTGSRDTKKALLERIWKYCAARSRAREEVAV